MIRKIINENLIYFIILLFLIIVCVIIKNTSLYIRITDFDGKAIDFFNNVRVNWFTNIMKIFTNIGDWYIPIALIVCIFLFIENKHYFYILAGSYAFAGLISLLAKYIILRPRPTEALINMPVTYSFPSGHTLTSIVFYLTFCYLLTKHAKGILKPIILFSTVLLIALIALSRMYLGVHFFSDVVGGLVFGIICEIAVINTIKRNFSEKV